MKKKYLAYAVLPVLGIALLGAGTASAHGWLGFGGGACPEDPARMAEHHQAMFQNHAEILGMDMEDLKDAWAEGKTIRDIAEEKGMDSSVLREKMQEARKAEMKSRLQALVEEGIITQAQANTRASLMEERAGSGKDGKPGLHRFDF